MKITVTVEPNTSSATFEIDLEDHNISPRTWALMPYQERLAIVQKAADDERNLIYPMVASWKKEEQE